jgi:formate hydrogenlyase subunit 3/multisubunit Na+/H+ antiporter MnhD subunit
MDPICIHSRALSEIPCRIESVCPESPSKNSIANSAISLGYYVPILSTLLFDATKPGAKDLKAPVGMLVSVIALAIITMYLGIFPQTLMSWIAQVSPYLLSPGVH